jgi:carbonic anhydrase/acetyltransferase-like protein (isoleucine patch superfamily)
MTISSFGKKTPYIDATAYVDPSATIIGSVVVCARCYIGPQAVLRGDFCSITVGEGSSIQDHCVLHGEEGGYVSVGAHARVGHSAVLHGCEVQDWAVIGLASKLLDKSVVGQFAMVAAGALVPRGQIIEPEMLVVGIPAKAVRQLTPAEIDRNLGVTARYVELAAIYASNQSQLGMRRRKEGWLNRFTFTLRDVLSRSQRREPVSS